MLPLQYCQLPVKAYWEKEDKWNQRQEKEEKLNKRQGTIMEPKSSVLASLPTLQT